MEPIFDCPISSSILKQAVNDLIKAAAIEATALSEILILEKDIIQKAKIDSANLEEFVSVNESVAGIIGGITKVQMITENKLQNIKELILQIEIHANNVPEETT